MKIIVLDTETVSINKPFCYDLGYLIYDTEERKVLDKKSFVIEQVWHNLALFQTAYYAEKRPLYVSAMRGKRAILTKWGYAMQEMKRDIKKYNVTSVYAFNSAFDDGVFTFNCDYYHCYNPLDTIPVYDIWGYSSQFITNTQEYRNFCEEHERFTDSGNYSGNAESVTQYLSQNYDFAEEHTALSDATIELAILIECVRNGAMWDEEYKVIKVLNRLTQKPFTIKINGEILYSGEYSKKYVRNDNYNFTL